MAAPGVTAGERLIGVRLGGAVTRSAPWRIADQEPRAGLSDRLAAAAAAQAAGAGAAGSTPRAVPHLAFLLGGPLTGPGVSAVDVLAAVASVHAAVELADGWFLTSPAGRSSAGLDLALEACLVEVDGQVTDSGTRAAGPAPGRGAGLGGQRARP